MDSQDEEVQPCQPSFDTTFHKNCCMGELIMDFQDVVVLP